MLKKKKELLESIKKTNIFDKIKKKIIVFIVTVIVILIAAVIVFFRGYKSANEKSQQAITQLEQEIQRLSDQAAVYEMASKEINLSVICANIQEIGELATIEYMYTDAGKFSDTVQWLGLDVPFTKKSFIAKWDGTIKAGINVKSIIVKINEKDKQIVVYMPKAEILSHEVDVESFETLDEQAGLFNPIELDNIREFDSKSKENMEKRAIENGILDKATENAKNVITKIVNTKPVQEQEYTIIFEEIKSEEKK